ncbi:MAG: HupE/UreJ family protein [Pseudomonadota bacterium]
MLSFKFVKSKLLSFLIVSSFFAVMGCSAQAHELQPTIGDFSVQDGEIRLELRINIGAFLANIDLDAITDTNDAENAADYDAVRALPNAEIATRAPSLLTSWNALPLLSVDGTPLVLRSIRVRMPQDVPPDQPRIALWSLAAELLPDAQTLTLRWPDGGGAMVLRQQGVDEAFTGFLSGGQSSPEISLQGGITRTGWQTFVAYIPVGFDHILPKGLDHILFVLGLFFLSTRLGPLVWQISSFTLAHTVTLALGAAGIVTIPAEIVEPLIAASIIYVAIENLFTSGLNPWRPVVVFGFGLLHGLGFASVLTDVGMPAGQFIPALLGFNIGVEFGQLMVLAFAFVLVGWAIKRDWYRQRIAMPASCAIAAVGAYWFVERVFL